MREEEKDRILIVGGGIAGLTLSIILKKVYNHKVIVFDKVPTIEAAGSGMSVIGHSLVLLDSVGVDVREIGLRQNDVSLRRSNGEVVLQTPTETADKQLTAEFGSAQFNVHRGELQCALLEAATNIGVTIKTGKKVTRVQQTSNNHASVTLDGGETLRGAVVFGCDGVHSVTRQCLQGMTGWLESPPRLRDCRCVCWRGITEDKEAWGGVWGKEGGGGKDGGWGGEVGEHPVMYKTVVHKGGEKVSFTVGRMGGGRTFWVFDIVMKEGEVGWVTKRERELREKVGPSSSSSHAPSSTSYPPGALHDYLLSCLGTDTSPEIKTVIRRTKERDIIRTELYDTSPHCFTAVAKGRVAIVGDAAHPMVHHFGQGACMAIEDSFRVGKLVEKYGGKKGGEVGKVDWEGVLGEYNGVGCKWRGFFFSYFSRVTGEMYVYNEGWWNTVLERVLFGWPLVVIFVFVLELLLFWCSFDLRGWARENCGGGKKNQ